MTNFSHAHFGEILVPIQENNFEPYNWPRAGAYPLFPYHNRLYNAAFSHAGERYRLLPHPVLTPDAMHGPAHRRPWIVASNADDRVKLQLNYEEDEEWPFSFLAEQHFILEPDRLIVELAITNLSERAAPVGLGWHPYVAAPLASHAETDAKLEYPLDEMNVPTAGPARPRPDHAIPSTSGYTLHFSDWNSAKTELNDGKLLLEADALFSHLAVHRMENYLCLEPVSMAAGVLSGPEGHREHRGLKVVPPGGCLSGRISLLLKN